MVQRPTASILPCFRREVPPVLTPAPEQLSFFSKAKALSWLPHCLHVSVTHTGNTPSQLSTGAER